jgi:manganese-dependent inorganic pyrophosphatase
MVGAMPFEVSIDRIERLLPDRPVLVVGERAGIIRYAVEKQFPAIILTGVESPDTISVDLEEYRRTVFLSSTDTAETVRLLRLSAPVEDIMGNDYPTITDETHFDDAKQMLLQSEYRGLPVFSSTDESRFLGLVTRRCFIDRPRTRLIMVDHNEADQSIRGIENADVVEIIDHHRLAPEKTRTPIYVAAKPVGSTCTIVYQHYLSCGEAIDIPAAKILLSGILSDTVLLKSPTTTAEDRTAVRELANIAGVDFQAFGEEMFSRTSVLSDKDPDQVITADFKVYREYGFSAGIGQVEVVTLEDLSDNIESLRKALDRVAGLQKLDWVMLLVTNVLKENSKLISRGPALMEKKLIYRKEEEGIFDLPGILSRKKQLLPEILRVLEDVSGG